MTRGFKNFLGIVLACIALSALFSSPVGFFDVVVAVMCIIAAILLLKPTESEKAAKKAKQSGNESKSMPTANTTDTAIETVKPTQITTQNEGYCHEPEPPVKPIVEHYSRNDDVVYLRHKILCCELNCQQIRAILLTQNPKHLKFVLRMKRQRVSFLARKSGWRK